MQEIAEEAGVNKALLHYYYRTKDGLAQAVFRRVASAFMPVIIETMASDLSLEAKAEKVVQHYLEVFARRPYLPGYLISEVTHHPGRLTPVRRHRGHADQEAGLTKLAQQIDERVRAGVGPHRPRAVPRQRDLPLRVPLRGAADHHGGPRSRREGFERFIAQRREALPPFVARALRP